MTKILTQIDKPELWVFSVDYERLGIVSDYSYYAVEEFFKGFGTFDLTCSVNSNNNKLISKDNIIWIKDTEYGMIIDTITNTSDANTRLSTYKIKGYLMNHILTYRSVLETNTFKNDYQSDVIASLIDSNMISTTDKRRIKNLSVDYNIDLGQPLTFQTTGNQVWDSVLDALNRTKDLGIRTNLDVFQYPYFNNFYDIHNTLDFPDRFGIDEEDYIIYPRTYNPSTTDDLKIMFTTKPRDDIILQKDYYLFFELDAIYSSSGMCQISDSSTGQFEDLSIRMNSLNSKRVYKYTLRAKSLSETSQSFLGSYFTIPPVTNAGFKFRITVRAENTPIEDFVYKRPDDTSGEYNEDLSIQVQVYQGVNRAITQQENAYVELNTKELDLKNSEYVVNVKDEKNVAYVYGEGTGSERINVITGSDDLQGMHRKELYIDARDLQSEDASGDVLTEEEYKTLLTDRGISKLAEVINEDTFNGQINLDSQPLRVFGRDYNVGDVISIRDDMTSRSANTRITSARYEWTPTGKIITLENDTNEV